MAQPSTINYGSDLERQLAFTSQGYKLPTGELYEKTPFGYNQLTPTQLAFNQVGGIASPNTQQQIISEQIGSGQYGAASQGLGNLQQGLRTGEIGSNNYSTLSQGFDVLGQQIAQQAQANNLNLSPSFTAQFPQFKNSGTTATTTTTTPTTFSPTPLSSNSTGSDFSKIIAGLLGSTTATDQLIAGSAAVGQATLTQEEKDTEAQRKLYVEKRKNLLEQTDLNQLLQSQETAFGVPSDLAALKQTKLEIAQKEGELNLGLNQIQGQPIPMQLIFGQQAELKRQGAIELGILRGREQALMDNINLSEKFVDRAVDLKYKSLQLQLNGLDKAIDDEIRFLEGKQKTRAEQMKDLISLQKEYVSKIADAEKNNLNDNNKLLADLAKANAPISLIQQIKTTSPYQDNVALVARSGFKFPSSETTTNYIPGTNPTVDNWAKLILSGQASLTNVPNPKGSNLRSQVVDAVTNSGQLILSDKDREKLSTLDTAFNVYETIKALSDKINTFDVVGRVTGYLGRYVGGATQYNEDIARYNATRQGFVSNVARTLGEKGTLAEGDVQRAIANLPTVNDTQAVAQGKLETLRNILDAARTSIIQKSTQPLSNVTAGTLSATNFSVRLPNSSIVNFPNQQSLDAFKKETGL